MLAIFAGLMLMVALACAGDAATPTSPPTSTSPAPTSTSPASTGPTATAPAGATAKAVPDVVADLTWMERYMQSPGYKPEWGQPVKGGTAIHAQPLTLMRYGPGNSSSCCYAHGCANHLVFNALFRTNTWAGPDSIEGDLVESWDFSGDGLTLTMQLRDGIMFHDNPDVPAELNGEKVRGDEFVCEDAKASLEYYVNPPEWETSLTAGARDFLHLDSATCPDGPRGYTFVMTFAYPLARTMSTLSKAQAWINDKDLMEWIKTEYEGVQTGRSAVGFPLMMGTGPFVPEELRVSVGNEFRVNPDYWREGLPLLDGWKGLVIKDQTTRFTALVTGKIHYFGEGSYSMTPGQVDQAVRDFPDKLVLWSQFGCCARIGTFNAGRPPFNDVRVRTAVHLAMDREEWSVFRESAGMKGTLLAYHLVPGGFYSIPHEELISKWPGLRQPKDQDIAEANRLMDEVFGAGERPKIQCMADASRRSDIDACLFIINQLKVNLNMEATSDFLEGAAFTPKLVAGGYDIYVGSFGGDYEPDNIYFTRYIRDHISFNYKGAMEGLWAEIPEVMEEVESMLLAQSRELDPQKRLKMVKDIEWKLSDEVNFILLLGWSRIFPAHSPELKGWVPDDFDKRKWSQWERVWLTK